MTASLRTKLVLGFAAALVVLGIVVALTYRSTDRFIEASRQSSAVRNHRLWLEQALSAAAHLETGQRDFLITGEDRHLERYASAIREMGLARSRLDSLTAVPSVNQEALVTANRLLDRKLNELATTIQVYRFEGPVAARARVQADVGKLTMDSLRQVVRGLEAEHSAEVARIDTAERRAASRTLLAVTVLTSIAVALFAALGLLLWRMIEAGRRRERGLEEQRAALDERVRVRTEEVRRRVAEMETLFAVVPIGIGVALDPECRDIRLNPALARMLGLTGDENASKSGPDGERLPFRCISYDGREIPADELVMQRAARTGRPVHNEAYRVVYPDGQAVDLLGSAAPLFDEQGAVRGAVGAFVDVSERRRADERIQHAERLQAVGQLAGGVAHEINNLMTTVLGFAEFALRGVGGDHSSAADLEQVLNAGRRAAEVAQQLLAFSRRQLVQPRVIRVDTALQELRPTLERMAGADVGLSLTHEVCDARVRMDLGQLSQVLINLVANARDAMPEGGRLAIVTRTLELDGAAAADLELPPGFYAVVTVSDSGAGMHPDVRRRAFEPFFTTKDVGSGTGLGLSIVYGIVTQAGGTVRLFSEERRGTRVEVFLPLVDEEVTAPAGDPPVPARSGERILVVEDDDVVRALAHRVLVQAGYEVIAAADGEEALRILDARAAELDLMVTDVVMPHLGGRALGRIVNERYPGVAVLYTSGYPGGSVIGREAPESETTFLPKPFTPDDLVRRVRIALDARPDQPGLASFPASSR